MTDVSEADSAPPPQTNGFADNGLLEEDERIKMRPADIDADMREMERRKRVEMIMSSRLFREELERIIETQMKDGGGPAGLLQQISDMMGVQGGRLQSTNFFKSSNCVVPINDIRGVESMGYAKGEKILRCKLAAVYRLMDLYGWTQNIYNHITARLNQDQEHFLVNPFGMLYHEVTASSLVKVDMQGSVVESGTTNFGVNAAAFRLHAAVHAARPDLKCIIHLHTPSVLAVSSLKCGLLPVSTEAVVIGEVSQHPYPGCVSEPEQREKLARDLGPINKVMFLTNHGALCCGETIEEAFYNVYNTVLASETQLKLMPVGIDNLQLIPDETRKQIYDAARNAPEGTAPAPSQIDKKERKFRIGGLEYEALMRMLDNAGFRTGYIYRQPLVKGDPPRPRNDVEVPPAVSSLGYLLEEEEMYKNGNWKKFADGRKSNDRTRWLNSPNVYQKVEILETGTPDPRKITKWVEANAEEWVADGSPQHSSTPVKIEHALQFVPKNTNPKEFKKLQQQIKENRRADKITSGPQSHILEGVSWEEAKKLQDANISQTGDQVILVGAASKGIIQRGFQHNATVYKTPYAKNPFDAVSDQELEDYKRVVTRKHRGESSYDEDQSESEALSSSAALPPTGIKSPASETEEESRDEPRVLRIETKQVPRPSQAEVVLSDEGESLTTDTDLSPSVMQRSKSSRYPQKESVNVLNRSNSLGRTKSNRDGCGNGNGPGDAWSNQASPQYPTLSQSHPQVVKISSGFTDRPTRCEVVSISGIDSLESLENGQHHFNFKKNFCDLFNYELKNEHFKDSSAGKIVNNNMTHLLEELHTKLLQIKIAKKKFFEEAITESLKLPELTSADNDVDIDKQVILKTIIADPLQLPHIVMLEDKESVEEPLQFINQGNYDHIDKFNNEINTNYVEIPTAKTNVCDNVIEKGIVKNELKPYLFDTVDNNNIYNESSIPKPSIQENCCTLKIIENPIENDEHLQDIDAVYVESWIASPDESIFGSLSDSSSVIIDLDDSPSKDEVECYMMAVEQNWGSNRQTKPSYPDHPSSLATVENDFDKLSTEKINSCFEENGKVCANNPDMYQSDQYIICNEETHLDNIFPVVKTFVNEGSYINGDVINEEVTSAYMMNMIIANINLALDHNEEANRNTLRHENKSQVYIADAYDSKEESNVEYSEEINFEFECNKGFESSIRAVGSTHNCNEKSVESTDERKGSRVKLRNKFDHNLDFLEADNINNPFFENNIVQEQLQNPLNLPSIMPSLPLSSNFQNNSRESITQSVTQINMDIETTRTTYPPCDQEDDFQINVVNFEEEFCEKEILGNYMMDLIYEEMNRHLKYRVCEQHLKLMEDIEKEFPPECQSTEDSEQSSTSSIGDKSHNSSIVSNSNEETLQIVKKDTFPDFWNVDMKDSATVDYTLNSSGTKVYDSQDNLIGNNLPDTCNLGDIDNVCGGILNEMIENSIMICKRASPDQYSYVQLSNIIDNRATLSQEKKICDSDESKLASPSLVSALCKALPFLQNSIESPACVQNTQFGESELVSPSLVRSSFKSFPFIQDMIETYGEHEGCSSINFKDKTNETVFDDTNDKDQNFLKEVFCEPPKLRRIESSESFNTISLDPLPRNTSHNELDSQEFTSDDDDTSTSEVIEMDDIEEVLPGFLDNTTQNCSLNNYLGAEFENGHDGSAVAVVDTDREPLYGLAVEVLTSSQSSSPEPDSLENRQDSLDYKVVFPINKPVYSPHWSAESDNKEGNYCRNELFEQHSTNNSMDSSTPSKRFNIDCKVPTFIVVDGIKGKSTQKLVKTSSSDHSPMLVNRNKPVDVSNQGSIKLFSENDSCMASGEQLEETHSNQDGDFFSLSASSCDSSATRFYDSNSCVDSNASCSVPDVLSLERFEKLPQSSPVNSMRDCGPCITDDVWLGSVECEVTSEIEAVESEANLSVVEFEKSKSSDQIILPFTCSFSYEEGSELLTSVSNSNLSKSSGYEADIDETRGNLEIGCQLNDSEYFNGMEMHSRKDNKIQSFSFEVYRKSSYPLTHKDEENTLESNDDEQKLLSHNISKNDLNELSYLSTAPVDDDISVPSDDSNGSVSVYSDSLLSGEDEEFVETSKQSNVNRRKRCCPYSPLAFKKDTSLPTIPELDSDLE